MRVVYLHQYFNTTTGSTRSYEMARRLVAMGHDVQLLTSDRTPGRNGNGSRGWRRSNEAGIDVHWLPVPYANTMGYGERIRAFLRFAWSAGRRAADLEGDVIFATSTPLTIALPAIYASRRNRIPMVFEVRDLWPEVPIALGALKNPLTIGAGRWLERLAYRHAAQVVALSPAIRAGVVRQGYPAERVTVIPNASDVAVFDVGPQPGMALRRQYSWLGNRPLVVYTGTLGQVNGVDYLARLAAEVQHLDPAICFVVIGSGRSEAAVRATAHELGVLGRTFFLLPEQPKAEIARWLSAAAIATSVVIDVPALWSNSANKVFDAFAASKPVAINHQGWLADVLQEAHAGLVLEPRDLGAAAVRLTRALHDRSWLARAGAAARQLAAKRFDRDVLSGQLERVLSTAICSSSGKVRQFTPPKEASRPA